MAINRLNYQSINISSQHIQVLSNGIYTEGSRIQKLQTSLGTPRNGKIQKEKTKNDIEYLRDIFTRVTNQAIKILVERKYGDIYEP